MRAGLPEFSPRNSCKKVVMMWWGTPLTQPSYQEMAWGGDRPAAWRVSHSDKDKERDSASKPGGRESPLFKKKPPAHLPTNTFLKIKNYEKREILFCIMAKEEKKYNPGFDSSFCLKQYTVHEYHIPLTEQRKQRKVNTGYRSSKITCNFYFPLWHLIFSKTSRINTHHICNQGHSY